LWAAAPEGVVDGAETDAELDPEFKAEAGPEVAGGEDTGLVDVGVVKVEVEVVVTTAVEVLVVDAEVADLEPVPLTEVDPELDALLEPLVRQLVDPWPTVKGEEF